MIRYIFLIFLISTICISCVKEEDKGRLIELKQTAPADLINKETFVSILVDMHLLEGANSLNLVESNKTRVNQSVYQELIFKKYGVSKLTFSASLSYYTSDYILSQKIYESVISELSRIQAANQ